MKKVLKANTRTKEYLDSLPKIYMVVQWARFGYRKLPFAGKCDKSGIPYVFDYYDGNGICDEYVLRKLTQTTTGVIYCWTTSKDKAEEIVDALNNSPACMVLH